MNWYDYQVFFLIKYQAKTSEIIDDLKKIVEAIDLMPTNHQNDFLIQ